MIETWVAIFVAVLAQSSVRAVLDRWIPVRLQEVALRLEGLV